VAKRRKGRYPIEFRRMAVERLKRCENIVVLSEELGVHRRLLYKWRDQLAPVDIGDEPLPENPRESTLRKEVSQLKRLLAEKTVELDFFKGALQKAGRCQPSRFLSFSAGASTGRGRHGGTQRDSTDRCRASTPLRLSADQRRVTAARDAGEITCCNRNEVSPPGGLRWNSMWVWTSLKRNRRICVIDGDGKRVWQGSCRSTPEAMAEVVRKKAPQAIKVAMETGPLAVWHRHELQAAGVPIVCIHARHAKAALSMQINKTDANDAFGLAQIVRTGWYRPVDMKSMESHKLRLLVAARARLVSMRTALYSQIRGLLKTFGVVLAPGKGGSFEQLVLTGVPNDRILSGVESIRRFRIPQFTTFRRRILCPDFHVVAKISRSVANCRHGSEENQFRPNHNRTHQSRR